MCETSEIIVVDKDSIDGCDPHGYFCDFRRPVLNFNSPTKRSFLNECIRQIYILNGDAMPNIPNTAVYNRYHLWNTLNVLMQPPKVNHYQSAVERVKRRLFRETKLRARKNKDVFRNIVCETKTFYFKHQRSTLGVRKIRRKYLDEVRIRIESENRQSLKRKRMDDDDRDIEEIMIQQDVMSKIHRYHANMVQRERAIEGQLHRERNNEACRLSRRAKKMEELLLEQQYQQRLLANEKALEASIRSILYMKALMGLMINGGNQQGEPRNLYV